MSDKRILFISGEIAPYVQGRPTADFSRDLAQNAHANKFEVRTFMPKYGNVNERRNQLHEVIRLSGANIPIDDNDHPLILKVASLQPSRIQVYFIDNDDYFQKSQADEDILGSNRSDNDERAIFFARGTLETVKKLRWTPAGVVCIGWMSALNPIFLRSFYADDPTLKDARLLYILTPEKVSAPIDPRLLEKLQQEGIAEDKLAALRELPADTNLLHRLAIDYSDGIVIADPEADPELLEYIASTGKPVMEFKEGDDLSGIRDFYVSLING